MTSRDSTPSHGLRKFLLLTSLVPRGWCRVQSSSLIFFFSRPENTTNSSSLAIFRGETESNFPTPAPFPYTTRTCFNYNSILIAVDPAVPLPPD